MPGFIELSLHTRPAQHEAVDYLQHGREGGLRARDRVKRLISSRAAHRTPDTARQPLQLVKETIPLLNATLPASISRQPQFANNVAPVLADSGQIQQVWMNLCVNAAHAIGAPEGRITLDVAAVAVRTGDGLTCTPGT
jgi:nitrogen-specific signal transduction histidine kinase